MPGLRGACEAGSGSGGEPRLARMLNRRLPDTEANPPLRAKAKTEGCESVVEKPNARSPEKFEALFDEIVALSTNPSPQDLADEAFLQRIDGKFEVGGARPEKCVGMFRGKCARLGLALRAEAVGHLMDEERPHRRMPRCACHPTDIPSRVAAICRNEGRTPELEVALTCRAYHGYLIES